MYVRISYPSLNQGSMTVPRHWLWLVIKSGAGPTHYPLPSKPRASLDPEPRLGLHPHILIVVPTQGEFYPLQKRQLIPLFGPISPLW